MLLCLGRGGGWVGWGGGGGGVHRMSLDPEPRAAASLGHRRLEATERMPLCMLTKALATGKATNEFNVLDKNEIQVDTYLSRSLDGEAA